MRILHVVPTYFPATRYGGPIQSVHGLCRALARRGHTVQVLTTNVDGDGVSDVPLRKSVEMDGVQVCYFPVPFLRRLYWSPEMKAAAIDRLGNCDVAHLHSVFLWPTTMMARAARRAGVPYVCAPRGMLERELIRRKSRWIKTAWLQLFEKRNLERAAAIHATSDREARELGKFGFALPRIAVIPNGVDFDSGADNEASEPGWLLGVPDSTPIVTFIGRISWKKGLDLLIPAIRTVPQARLVVAGPDDEGLGPELARLALEHGVSQRVVFPGEVHKSEKQALLRRSAAFVLPSISENFGNSAVEAMAAGVPVIVTSGVGVAEFVEGHGAGLVTGNSVDELGTALHRILSDHAAARAMGEKGKLLAAGRFSWAAVAAQTEALYEEVAAK